MNLKKSKCRVSTIGSTVCRENIALVALLLAAASARVSGTAAAGVYSISEIQYTTDPDGRSPLEGQVIDCRGGIVTHMFPGGKPKLTIQDPNRPFAWGAIQVKDGLTGAPLFHQASVGDWVTISNVYVEEYRGNTTLQCLPANNPTLTVLSHNNPLPRPLAVTPEQIAAPASDGSGDWYVKTHDSEKYEHMRLKVVKVSVEEMNLGKAADNYVLQSVQDPNANCWASDYMNADAPGDYHPSVSTGQRFCSVEGILEQYTSIKDGWDYYQLLTTTAQDISVSQIADFDEDCDVDFVDFRLFAERWLANCGNNPADCAGSDLNGNGTVGVGDLTLLADHWLDGKLARDKGDDDGQP
jgi:hypothetical protein